MEGPFIEFSFMYTYFLNHVIVSTKMAHTCNLNNIGGQSRGTVS
jgi:hypothetical protein